MPERKNRWPSFPLYPDKLIAGTDHLTAFAFRAYMRIMCWMWLHSDNYCSIKNNQILLKNVTGLTPKKFTKYWENEVMNPDMPLLKTEGEFLVSNGLRKEYEKLCAYSKKQSDRAKGKPRLNRGIATAEPGSSSSSSSSPSIKEVKERELYINSDPLYPEEFKQEKSAAFSISEFPEKLQIVIVFYCRTVKIKLEDYVLTNMRSRHLLDIWQKLVAWAKSKKPEAKPEVAFCAAIKAWWTWDKGWYKKKGLSDLTKHCCPDYEKLEGFIHESRKMQENGELRFRLPEPPKVK